MGGGGVPHEIAHAESTFFFLKTKSRNVTLVLVLSCEWSRVPSPVFFETLNPSVSFFGGILYYKKTALIIVRDSNKFSFDLLRPRVATAVDARDREKYRAFGGAQACASGGG